MFFRSGHRKSSNPLLSLFRLLMSLIIIAILGIGLLQAYKAFSGYDPMKLDSQSLQNLLSSGSAEQALNSLLSLNSRQQTGETGQGDPGSLSYMGKISNAPVLFKFAVLADSHKDTLSLERALNQVRDAGVRFVIIMGDLSDVGTLAELESTKRVLDASGLTYYAAAGDHDLWDSRDKESDAPKNFTQVFGKTYQSFSDQGVRFILIYNSDNYLGLDGVQLAWVEDELNRSLAENPKIIFAFAPTPLFHPSSDHVMGKVTPKLASQAEHLMTTFKKSGVDLVFSSYTHFYSKFIEPKNNLDMITVGAVTSEKNPQAPRFAMVEILDDGNFNVVETEIK